MGARGVGELEIKALAFFTPNPHQNTGNGMQMMRE